MKPVLFERLKEMRATCFVLVLAMTGVFSANTAAAVLGMGHGRGFISCGRGGNRPAPGAVTVEAGSSVSSRP
jgi:hypothetical protein